MSQHLTPEGTDNLGDETQPERHPVMGHLNRLHLSGDFLLSTFKFATRLGLGHPDAEQTGHYQAELKAKTLRIETLQAELTAANATISEVRAELEVKNGARLAALESSVRRLREHNNQLSVRFDQRGKELSACKEKLTQHKKIWPRLRTPPRTITSGAVKTLIQTYVGCYDAIQDKDSDDTTRVRKVKTVLKDVRDAYSGHRARYRANETPVCETFSIAVLLLVLCCGSWWRDPK
jgi:hypothetical protein